MDTTYFGRQFGVMVFRDAVPGQILWKQYVKQETNQLYLAGITEITRRGTKIQTIVSDGRKGLFQLFENDIHVQMCHFHQVAIVRRYLAKSPNIKLVKSCGRIGYSLPKQIRRVLKVGCNFGVRHGRPF